MKLKSTAILLLPLALLSPGQAIAQDAPPAKVQAANPDAAGHYHVGDGVTSPKLVYAIAPEYTEEARKKRIMGVCTLSVTVDEAGIPRNIKVARSLAESQPVQLRQAAAGLDPRAMEAMAGYRFRPGTFKGKPVPVDLLMEVQFQLF